jgi:magnesium transporter
MGGGAVFFQYPDKLTEVAFSEADRTKLAVGFVSGEELAGLAPALGIAPAAVAACASMDRYFRSGVEVYDDYTYTQLRVSEPGGRHYCVAMFIKRDLIVLVDVEDPEGTVRDKFMGVLGRYTAATVSAEKLLCAFFDSLIAGDMQFLERTGFEISELEEDVVHGKTDKDFNIDILAVKKELLIKHNFYEQLLDIAEALEEDDNDLFPDGELRLLSNIVTKITRLREDIDSLNNSAAHLQDAYQASLDLKLNNSMKFFTVLTTVFFPLTIIVGWYGMNFDSMPEFHWRFGYIYVIALSLAVVAVFGIFAKKRKWF